MRDPRVAAVLRQVLPAHHDRPAARVRATWWSMYCDAYASLFMRKPRSPRPTSCTRIASHVTSTSPRVRHLEAPQPEIAPGMQPQRDAVPHAAGGAVPDEAIGAGRRNRPWRPARPPPRPPAPARRGGGTAGRSRHRAAEPCTWLIMVRPRSCRCSIANTQALGRTPIDSPAWLSIRRRPRSVSRGVSKVRGAECGIAISRLRPKA